MIGNAVLQSCWHNHQYTVLMVMQAKPDDTRNNSFAVPAVEPSNISQGFDSRMVYVDKDDLDRLTEFDSELPPAGESAEEVLAMLDRTGSPVTAGAPCRCFSGA